MNKYEIVFESDRIYFVKINYDLVNEYLEMVNDEEVQKCIRHDRVVYSYDGEVEWIKDKIENNSIAFSMIDKETLEFIGNIEILHEEDKVGELAIAITPLKQNMHFGTEAINRILEYAFNDLKLDGMYLKVFETNSRAIKCYENCGFVKDGKENDEIHMTYKKKDI